MTRIAKTSTEGIHKRTYGDLSRSATVSELDLYRPGRMERQTPSSWYSDYDLLG